jgi:hypothetical protein
VHTTKFQQRLPLYIPLVALISCMLLMSGCKPSEEPTTQNEGLASNETENVEPNDLSPPVPEPTFEQVPQAPALPPTSEFPEELLAQPPQINATSFLPETETTTPIEGPSPVAPDGPSFLQIPPSSANPTTDVAIDTPIDPVGPVTPITPIIPAVEPVETPTSIPLATTVPNPTLIIDVTSRIDLYIDELTEYVEDEEAYLEDVDAIRQDANVLILLAITSGTGQPNKYRPNAGGLLASAQLVARATDYGSAQEAVSALAAVRTGVESMPPQIRAMTESRVNPLDPQWVANEKSADLVELMKAVAPLSMKFRQATGRESTIDRYHDMLMQNTATLAVIARGSLPYADETKRPDAADQWAQFCTEFESTALELNQTVHTYAGGVGTFEAIKTSNEAFQETCHSCHEIFNPKDE